MSAWKHFKTITKHKLMVMKYCFRIGLYKQGLLHDLSKYSPSEFLVGAKYFQGDRSPNNAEREATGVSRSWLHHKGRNKHHFEYWIDYDMKSKEMLAGIQMPRKYVAEMIMDRICASKVYMEEKYTNQGPLAYYQAGTKDLWFIHKETKRQLEMLITMLANKGEKETLAYIKDVFLKGQ